MATRLVKVGGSFGRDQLSKLEGASSGHVPRIPIVDMSGGKST